MADSARRHSVDHQEESEAEPSSTAMASSSVPGGSDSRSPKEQPLGGLLGSKRRAGSAELVDEERPSSAIMHGDHGLMAGYALSSLTASQDDPEGDLIDLELLKLVRVTTDDLQALKLEDAVDESVINAAQRKKNKAEALLRDHFLTSVSRSSSTEQTPQFHENLLKLDTGEIVGEESKQGIEIDANTSTGAQPEHSILNTHQVEILRLEEEEEEILKKVRIAEDEVAFLRSQESVDPSVLSAAIRKKKKLDVIYGNAVSRTLEARRNAPVHDIITSVNDGRRAGDDDFSKPLPQSDSARPRQERVAHTPRQLQMSLALCEAEEETLRRIIDDLQTRLDRLHQGVSDPDESQYQSLQETMDKLQDRLHQAQIRTAEARDLLGHGSLNPGDGNEGAGDIRKVVVAEIKPVSEDIDVEMLGRAIVELEAEGIDKWMGEPKLLPFGFGAQKLQLAATISMLVDDFCDKISLEYPGDIQEIEILSATPFRPSFNIS